MIATPDDCAWFSYERFPELAEAYCFTYVHGLTPEQLVVRLGGRPEDFTPMTLEELIETSYRNSYDTAFLGATTIGDCVFIVEPNGGLGIDEEIITPLSAGTRLVSHFRDPPGGASHRHHADTGAAGGVHLPVRNHPRTEVSRTHRL
ncbi:DUF6461 domain-containing protein [Nonomuraea dietziae]|uniref:DUF6461 domain-containing protein n=1 Tax=Nonomuraea dietziae TaxID=65515 RepID=UPI003F4E392E